MSDKVLAERTTSIPSKIRTPSDFVELLADNSTSKTNKLRSLSDFEELIVERRNSRQSKLRSISHFEGNTETVVAAEISLPEEGGWGWVVVTASFFCLFILDGIFFTFSTIYQHISGDLNTNVSLVTLINSVTVSLYYIMGPVISAFINRFGFRSCAMAGSIITSVCYFVTYFAYNYATVLIFYGIFSGIGGCFLYMSSQLVVGFYFERLRAVAVALTGLGQSFGVMCMNVINTEIVSASSWRTATLFHSGLFGIIYFISMAYRPLISVTVTNIASQPSLSLPYLPSLSSITLKENVSKRRCELSSVAPSASERLFKASSNVKFPTAADLLEEDENEDEYSLQAGPSRGSGIMYNITARSPTGGVSEGHLRTIQKDQQIEVTMSTVEEPPKQTKWWKTCCRWRKHIDESRPMYRDDAFYEGQIEKLPAYQRSRRDLASEKLTGLEYRMAVSRTVTAADLKEPKGIFTTAVRRILATMMNPVLLRRKSFLMLCTTGFLTHVGLMVPYIFLPDRNRERGIDSRHCKAFVSVIGLSNAFGRIMAGILAYKYNQPVAIYSIACLTAGTAIIVSCFSFNLIYQYLCCVIFGISTATISTLRSLVIVDLYGLENLTNATGILLLFQGLGILLGTPVASLITSGFGYFVAFILAGSFIVTGGLLCFFTKRTAVAESTQKRKQYIAIRPLKKPEVRTPERKRSDSIESGSTMIQTFRADSSISTPHKEVN